MDDETGYTAQGEPDRAKRGYYWNTAIGLQQVDGLTPSKYLRDTAKANIAGEITLTEAERRIADYYARKPAVTDDEKHSEEADKVSLRIAQLLSEDAFTLSPAHLLSIHGYLFAGLYGFAGQIRDYNISKDEWVLGGESVIYSDFRAVRAELEYDIEKEKAFQYNRLDERETVRHITKFIADLWQIHVFGEGNTRTIAVFTIKYLRSFGYDAANDTFEKHSQYFRDALVRTNYNNVRRGIAATQKYLDLFFGNLLFGEQNILQSRDLHISADEQTAKPSVIEQIHADQQRRREQPPPPSQEQSTHKNDTEL
jgi:fido (protein-threonine AMPylation protein)